MIVSTNDRFSACQAVADNAIAPIVKPIHRCEVRASTTKASVASRLIASGAALARSLSFIPPTLTCFLARTTALKPLLNTRTPRSKVDNITTGS